MNPCTDYREELSAIAAGMPLPLARRGEVLHHAEGCDTCGRCLARLRATWDVLGPDFYADPDPGPRQDAAVARAVHLARASESSVTAIPIVIDRGEPPRRRWRPVFAVGAALAAAAVLAAGAVLLSVRPWIAPSERVGAAAAGLAPDDAVYLVEAELRDHPDDPELWRMLGNWAAEAGDAEALCRGFGGYLALRPAAPDRENVRAFTADRLASLGKSGLCTPGSDAPVPAP